MKSYKSCKSSPAPFWLFVLEFCQENLFNPQQAKHSEDCQENWKTVGIKDAYQKKISELKKEVRLNGQANYEFMAVYWSIEHLLVLKKNVDRANRLFKRHIQYLVNVEGIDRGDISDIDEFLELYNSHS